MTFAGLRPALHEVLCQQQSCIPLMSSVQLFPNCGPNACGPGWVTARLRHAEGTASHAEHGQQAREEVLVIGLPLVQRRAGTAPAPGCRFVLFSIVACPHYPTEGALLRR